MKNKKQDINIKSASSFTDDENIKIKRRSCGCRYFFYCLIIAISLIAYLVYYVYTNDKMRTEQIDLRGLEVTKNKKVIFAGIVRDNAPELPRVIRYIENSAKLFKDYRIVIFENDSSDGTDQILLEWARDNPKVKILQESWKNKKRPNIGFLATARNKYLEEITHNPLYKDFDIIAVIDMDMDLGWSNNDIALTFSKIHQWDAVCANGVFDKGKTWDVFAFRNEEFPYGPNEVENYWHKTVYEAHKIYPKNSDLMPVYSCFGGLAFYKKNIIKNCQYFSDRGDCEHVSFHQCLREKNNAAIYMNPALLMYYRPLEDLVLNLLFADSLQRQIVYSLKKWLNIAIWRIDAKYSH